MDAQGKTGKSSTSKEREKKTFGRGLRNIEEGTQRRDIEEILCHFPEV